MAALLIRISENGISCVVAMPEKYTRKKSQQILYVLFSFQEGHWLSDKPIHHERSKEHSGVWL